jgi:hypothetical protein
MTTFVTSTWWSPTFGRDMKKLDDFTGSFHKWQKEKAVPLSSESFAEAFAACMDLTEAGTRLMFELACPWCQCGCPACFLNNLHRLPPPIYD